MRSSNSYTTLFKEHGSLLLLAVKLSARPIELADGITFVTDYTITYTRNGDVFTEAIANDTNSDEFNSQSIFNQNIFVDGMPDKGLTPAGWALFDFSLALNLISYGVRVYQLYNKIRKTMSASHLRECLHELDPKLHLTNEEIQKKANKLLHRGKIARHEADKGFRVEVTDSGLMQLVYERPDPALNPENAEEDDMSLLDEEYSATSAEIKKEEAIDEAINKLYPEPFPVRIINRIRNSAFGTTVRALWDNLFMGSMLYWVFSYSFMVLKGVAQLAVGTVVASVTLIPALIYFAYTAIWKSVSAVTVKKNGDEKGPIKVDILRSQEEEYKFREITQRVFMKTQHKEYYRDKLFAKAAGFKFHFNVEKMKNKMQAQAVEEKEINEAVEEATRTSNEIKKQWKQKWAAIKQKVKEEEEYLNINLSQNASHRFKRDTVENVLDSDLARHLLGSKVKQRTHLGLKFVLDIINGFVMILFTVSLVSALFAAAHFIIPAVVAAKLTVVGNFLAGSTFTSNIIVTSVCAGIGLLFGINSLVRSYTANRDRAKKVYTTLSAEYKNEGISKLEKFNRLQALIDQKKHSISQFRKELTPDNKHENALFDYNLDDVNVYNNYYFEKQKQSPSSWTRAKQGIKSFFESTSGVQSTVYTARFLALAGGVAGTALLCTGIGALPAFITLAVTAGVVGGLLRLAVYQMEREQRHRDFFANTIDTRISYQRKKLNELTFIEEALKEKKVITEETAPRSRMSPASITVTQAQEPKVEVTTTVSQHHHTLFGARANEIIRAREQAIEAKTKLINELMQEEPSPKFSCT